MMKRLDASDSDSCTGMKTGSRVQAVGSLVLRYGLVLSWFSANWKNLVRALPNQGSCCWVNCCRLNLRFWRAASSFLSRAAKISR
jgi:hypothetical protein